MQHTGSDGKHEADYLALLSYYTVVIALWALLAVTASGFVVELGGSQHFLGRLHAGRRS